MYTLLAVFCPDVISGLNQFRRVYTDGHSAEQFDCPEQIRQAHCPEFIEGLSRSPNSS